MWTVRKIRYVHTVCRIILWKAGAVPSGLLFRGQSPKVNIAELMIDEPFLPQAAFQHETGFFQRSVGSRIVDMNIGFNADESHIPGCKIAYCLHTRSVDSPVPVFAFQEISDGAGCIFRLEIIELNLPDWFPVIFNDPGIIVFSCKSLNPSREYAGEA